MKKAGHTQSEITTVINQSVSTISRTLSRNRGARGYRPKQAYNKAVERKAINTRAIDDDWQANTIIGKNHRQAIVSLVERKTGYTLIRKVERKTRRGSDKSNHSLAQATPKTGAYDYFRQRAGIRRTRGDQQTTGRSFYFAHPYASWERGTNENTNGLIRQYFPKNRDFTTITQQEMDTAMQRLNNQPRKRLGYQTPNQIFFKSGVALHI